MAKYVLPGKLSKISSYQAMTLMTMVVRKRRDNDKLFECEITCLCNKIFEDNATANKYFEYHLIPITMNILTHHRRNSLIKVVDQHGHKISDGISHDVSYHAL